jgi:membrane protein
MRLGASLAYYAVFSIFPLLLLAITVLGFVLGQSPDTRRALLDAVSSATTPSFKTLFDQTLDDMQQHETARGIGAVVGLVTLIFGASGVFSELQHALNQIWRVPTREGKEFWDTVLHHVRRKILSFVVVLAAAIAILVSIVITTILSYLGERFEGVASGVVSHTTLLMVIENVGSITVLTLMLASMFRLIPHAPVEWRDVTFGALVTAVLFTFIKHGVSYYLARIGSYAAYGAVGGFLCLLTWIYLASLFLFYGAELARVYAERYGSLATPSVAPSPAPAPP